MRTLCNAHCPHFQVTPMGRACRCRKADRSFGAKDAGRVPAWCPENKAAAADVAICRGPEKGCSGKAEPCPDCYRVSSNDPRSTEEILGAMNRGDA